MAAPMHPLLRNAHRLTFARLLRVAVVPFMLVLLIGVAIIRLRELPASAGSTLTIILTPKGLTPTHTPSAPITLSIAQGAQQIFTTTIAPVNNTATVDLPTNVSSIVSDLQVTLSSPLWTKMSFTVSGGLSGRSITTGSLFYGDMNKDGTLTTADLVLAILCRRNSAACPAEMSGTPLTLANLVTIVRLSRTAIVAPTISAPASSVAGSSASSASSVAPVAAGSVKFPHATGSDQAREFFLKFQNRDPNKLDVTLDDIMRTPSTTRSWLIMPRTGATTGWAWQQWGASDLSLGIDANGRRYLESRGGDPNLDLGFWWIQNGYQDAQLSDSYPNALAANRVSFLLRAPDQIKDANGVVYDVRTNPMGYAKVLGYYKGNYQQADGYGMSDFSPENDDWHYYWFFSSYWDHQPAPIKVEYLGNQFQRVTFGEQYVGTRSSNKFGAGIYGPVDADLAAFAGDIFTTYRTETRVYFQQPASSGVDFVRTGDRSGDPVAAGERVIQYYGASHWYEDNGVSFLAYPANNPSGTPVVQMAIDANGPRYVDIPFTLKNTQAKAMSFWLSLSEDKIPIFEPASAAANAKGLLTYEDVNGNQILDASEESGKRMGAVTRALAPNETLRGIMRLDTSKMALDTTEPRALTVRAKDPDDPMSLKGASISLLTRKTATPATVCEDNIFYFTGPGLSTACPANQAPEAKIQISLSGRVLSAGDTVTAGSSLLIKSLGTDPDGQTNALNKMSHRVYLPDGKSVVINGPTGMSYKPWMSGENMFMVETGDGKARSYQSLKLNVVQAANVPPTAKINQPADTDVYRAGDRIPFAAWSTDVDNYDPDGGGPNTLLGIVRFDWDFGDGGTAVNNRTPYHAYDNAGTYTVKLTATDDEGSKTTVQKTITVIVQNRPPVAKICVTNPSQLQQYGAVELNAGCSTDADGFDDIKLFRWKFQGPNGYTDLSNLVIQDNPRLAINAWEAGDYTAMLDIWDSRNVMSHAETTFTVPPWQGVIRMNIIAADGGPGQAFFNHDIRQVKLGWTMGYQGVGFSGAGPLKMGFLGGKTVYATTFGLVAVRNNTVPANTPPDLVPIFMSAVDGATWGPEMFVVNDLPKGKYQVTAYMYRDDQKAPGTQYKVNFGNLVFSSVIPQNPTVNDFTYSGVLDHPGGNMVISGAQAWVSRKTGDPYSPLAGFTMTPIP